MTLKEQLNTLKDNWLIALIVVAFALTPLFLSTGNISSKLGNSYLMGATESLAYDVRATSSYYPTPSSDFAPEVQERIITKTADFNTEVQFGTYKESEQKLKAIIQSSDSFLLNENVNKYGQALKQYYSGYYQIKVESGKYDSVISQLKEIGEIQSFSENAQDLTGRYTNTKVELDAERGRLQRYQAMYNEAINVQDKINLNDKIYDQERIIKYLEDSLKNIDSRVDYSTVTFSMQEERSEYSDIAMVKLSELVTAVVGSFNNLIYLIFWALPYALAILIIVWIRRFVKDRY